MQSVIELFVKIFNGLFGLTNELSFDVYGIQIGYGDILLGFLALGIIVTVFWKGAQT